MIPSTQADVSLNGSEKFQPFSRDWIHLTLRYPVLNPTHHLVAHFIALPVYLANFPVHISFLIRAANLKNRIDPTAFTA